MALADLENLVRLALDCGLTGPDMRQQLMRALPAGFVYSLPTVSRPIDQLRFDLMELDRTPRLIGLDRPPLAVWLANAADICVTRGRADAAQAFAAEADRLAPSAGVSERVAAAVAAGGGSGTSGGGAGVAVQSRVGQVSHGSAGIVHGPVTINNYASGAPATAAASQPASSAAAAPGFPRERRALVLTMHPDAEMAWRAVEPPLEPQGRVYHAATLRGTWHQQYPPPNSAWRHAVENLDGALEKIQREAQHGDCLAVFAKVPVALGAFIGSRLRERLAVISHLTVFEAVALAHPPWRPWGPAWSRPVAPDPDVRFSLRTPKAPAGSGLDIALIVQIGEVVDDEPVIRAMTEAGAPDAHVASLAANGSVRRIPLDAPGAIEGAYRDLREGIEDLYHGHPKLKRLHLFYAGPLALMIRLAIDLSGRRFRTTIYEFRADETYVPAVKIGAHRAAALVERDDLRVPGAADDYDVFLAYPGADAEYAGKLYDALTERRLRVFFDQRSLLPGEVWASALPAALARSRATIAVISPDIAESWYQRSEFQQAIEQMRRAPGAHLILPLLTRGTQQKDLPYELRPLVSLDVGPHDAVYATADRICELLQRQPSEDEVAAFRQRSQET